ncbi:NHLM bacteriocin system ABC transporter, ATP-binding protein [Ruminococcaceae bacterium YRB3002]|nr:NHLM bacteriocin system ABC transporter, ATP-binding protein [Ruminococcaceae bacterium YRB3002]
MKHFESQMDTRSRLDTEITEKAYAELASSVLPPDERVVYQTDNLERFDKTVSLCLQHYRLEAGEVHGNVPNPEERTDYICRPSGAMHRSVVLTKNWRKKTFGAMAGQLKDGTPVAILPRKMYGFDYVEPVTGKRIPVNSKTESQIDDRVILFYPPLPARPLTVRDIVGFIFGSFSQREYLKVFVAALVASLIGLMPAWVNQIAFGIVIPSGKAYLIMPIAALLLGVTISTLLINTGRSLLINRVTTRFQVNMEAAIYARVLMFPSSFFRKYSSGNLSNRIMKLSQLTQELTSLVLGVGLNALLSMVYIGQIFHYTPELTGTAFLIVLLQTVFIVASIRVTARFEMKTMNSGAKLSGTVTTLLNGIQKIKLSGAENRAFAKWAHEYAEYAHSAYNRPWFVRAMPACITMIGLLGTVVLYYIAGNEELSVADYMTFSTAYGMMTAAVMSLSGLIASTVKIRPLLEMSRPILETVPEVSGDKVMVTDINGGVKVNNVSFRYEENTPWILEDLSFTIRSGEYVAFVGRSGCGKSTIVRLLLGFENPVRGSVFCGHYDVANVDTHSLRRHIGTVMQNSKLFHGDIFSNIILSSPSSTEEDAWKAAEMVGIAEDIRQMPMGMHTIITEGGGGISGGQRQRLLIARAICGGRKMLIFDEATSALDNLTQKHVADSLATLKGTTRIVVAHRLSTVQNCDRIFVVDGGKIAESGTYDELMQLNGVFAELVARQQLDP